MNIVPYISVSMRNRQKFPVRRDLRDNKRSEFMVGSRIEFVLYTLFFLIPLLSVSPDLDFSLFKAGVHFP